MGLSEERNNRRPNTEDAPPWPHVRLADTDRLESFSDSVFAITITLLVAEIVRPEYEPGHLLEKLLAQWPNYVAFLASFFYIGIIWLNHRAVFARVRYCDRSLHLANLFCLLASALIPFPTAVLSTALQHANPFDATIAVALYAAIGGVMCLAWLLLFHVLSIHSYLLEDHVDPTFFPKERHRAVLGVALYAAGGVIGCPAGSLSGSGRAVCVFVVCSAGGCGGDGSARRWRAWVRTRHADDGAACDLHDR